MQKTIHWGVQTPTQRTLWEHRRSIQNHDELISPTPVSTHFNRPCYKHLYLIKH